MTVLIVGLGSMGKRRLRLIKQYDPSVQIMGVESNMARCREALNSYGIKCYRTIDEAFECAAIDCAFICTSPLSHASIILKLLELNIHIFTEINLVNDRYEKIIQQINKKRKVVFLSSTFLYRKDIRYIIERSRQKRVNYLYHTGQYLPDWHPWENYKDFFVADSRTNGCREIMAIEFPWIMKCFGPVKSFKIMKDKMSGLQVDYCDNFLLMIEHENGNKGMIAIDIVSRIPRRELEIWGENIQLFWKGTPNSLEELDIDSGKMKRIPTYESVERDNNYCDNIIENAYLEEIRTFFGQVKGEPDAEVMHDFCTDRIILDLIDKIEGKE